MKEEITKNDEERKNENFTEKDLKSINEVSSEIH